MGFEIVCHGCGGEGKIRNTDYEGLTLITSTCSKCNGFGFLRTMVDPNGPDWRDAVLDEVEQAVDRPGIER